MKWPEELPQCPLRADFSGTTNDGAIRQEMDAGPAYQRPRYTAIVEPFEISLQLSREQFKRFRDFWFKELLHGSQPFDWIHPDTLETARVQFDVSKGFTREPSGKGLKVSATLEVLPQPPEDD